MREPAIEDTVPAIGDGENLTNHENFSSPDMSADEQPEEEQPEDVPAGEEQAAAEHLEDEHSEEVEELSSVELPDAEPFVVDPPPARTLSANKADSSYQRRLPIRYGISDNSTRASKKHPEAKHLTIKFPAVVAQLFAGVWVAVKGDAVFVDLFARNGQNDSTGYTDTDPWRWIKIKDSGEIAMAISRPYTKSRTDGELVRDYVVGAFKLVVPLDITSAGVTEPGQEQQSSSRRLFS